MLIDRFINRWTQWERRFMPAYVWQADPLTFWRERILFTMCFIAVFLGPLALIPSVWLAYTEGLINVVVLDLAAYGSVFFIFFGRRLSLKVRAWMACLLLYALGVGLLFLLGHIGAGYMWLFGASVMIAAILGFWAAISSLVLNGLTFVAVACFAVYGTPEWAQPVENVLQKWIVMGGNFLLLNVLVTLTVGFMLEGLQKTLQKEQDTSSRLMQSENQYRLLAENATDTIWILNLSTLTFEYFSPSIERIRGYTPAEAQALSLEQHLSSESYQKAIDILNEELSIDNEEGIDKNRSRTIEIKQSIKGGGYVWAEAIVSFVRDNDGKPTAVMGVTRDIEARKKAEAVLIESEKNIAIFLKTVRTCCASMIWMET